MTQIHNFSLLKERSIVNICPFGKPIKCSITISSYIKNRLNLNVFVGISALRQTIFRDGRQGHLGLDTVFFNGLVVVKPCYAYVLLISFKFVQ